MDLKKFPSIEYALSLPLYTGATFTLDLPKILFEKLGNPQDKLKIIHVAGTNGKGSTSAMIAAMLYAEGKSVAQFLSPHLTQVCERCTINGLPAEPEKYEAALARVIKASRECELSPSFFVFSCAATILCALEEKVDYLVLEVGLGGRLDATNLVKKPLVSVITSVGLDHTHILGETEYEIAKEKAGILKEGVPAYVGEVSEEAKKGILELAEAVGVDPQFVEGEVETTLKGKHQRRNAKLAVSVCRELGVSEGAIEKGLKIVRFPGRLESFDVGGREVLLDIAHNPQGIASLVAFLNAERVGCDVVFLMSILNRKSPDKIFEVMEGLKAEAKYVFSESSHPSSFKAGELAEMLPGSLAVSDLGSAYQKALEHAGEIVVVTGSLFFVSEVREAICGNVFSTIEKT